MSASKQNAQTAKIEARSQGDYRREIPATDKLLALPEVKSATATLSLLVVKNLIKATQDRARRKEILPSEVAPELIKALESQHATALTAVINATGVIIHTNLGRAPLSAAAVEAINVASGYVDLEFDLESGARGRRAKALRSALLASCPAAEDALVVNNGAAALALVAATLAGPKAKNSSVGLNDFALKASSQESNSQLFLPASQLLLSRGEIIEIGAGFRLLELMQSTGASIKEIGSTNRTHLIDYEQAIDENTAGILKIHASNYLISGFTAEVSVAELASLAKEHKLPLVVDIGSGLFNPESLLPNEPDLSTALTDGAELVICSGDKLIGGPQAGIILGKSEWIAKLSRHPLARAFRADKLQIAALEATLSGQVPPVLEYLRLDPEILKARSIAFIERLPKEFKAELVKHEGRVGAGGGAEVPLPGYAIALSEHFAPILRQAKNPIVATTKEGKCLIDLRCVSQAQEALIISALIESRN